MGSRPRLHPSVTVSLLQGGCRRWLGVYNSDQNGVRARSNIDVLPAATEDDDEDVRWGLRNVPPNTTGGSSQDPRARCPARPSGDSGEDIFRRGSARLLRGERDAGDAAGERQLPLQGAFRARRRLSNQGRNHQMIPHLLSSPHHLAHRNVLRLRFCLASVCSALVCARVVVRYERDPCNCGALGGDLQNMISRTQKTIKQFTADVALADKQLTITLRSNSEDYMLSAEVHDDQLPPSFTNIFDSVAELFNFIKDAGNGALDVTGSSLRLFVKAVKLREVLIELARSPVSRQDLVERRVDKLELAQKNAATAAQKETQRLFEDYSKKMLKPLTDEVRRLAERVVSLEDKLKVTRPLAISAASTSNGPLFSHSISPPSRASQLPIPRNRPVVVEPQGRVAIIEEGEGGRRAKDFLFDIDYNNKHLGEFFVINGKTVTRRVENEEIYMFSSSNPIPPTDRHSLSFRIERVVEGLMWVGLLAENKKQEQYIGEETGIMQFSLEGSKVIIDGKSYNIKVPEFKDGQVLSMEVEIPTRKLRIYRNGKPNPLIKLTIPETMANGPLYPYVQFIGEGDAITFL